MVGREKKRTLLGFPRLEWLRREAEVGHLGALREQPPS